MDRSGARRNDRKTSIWTFYEFINTKHLTFYNLDPNGNIPQDLQRESKKWLTGLKTQAEVLAPAKENGLWTYRNFDGQDFPRSFHNSRLPPKGLFLESLKALFEWKSPDGSLQVHPPCRFGRPAGDLRRKSL